MPVLKSFLSLLGLFLLTIVFVGFFLPKEDKVSIKKTIPCTVDHIYPLVNDLRKWEQWSPWHRLDPKMQITYSQNTEGTGASYSWKGNSNVGQGEMKIVQSITNQRIDMSLNYDYQGFNDCGMIFSPTQGGTEVEWWMNASYPENPILKKIFGGYGYVMMRYFLNKDFSAGLDNISEVCKN